MWIWDIWKDEFCMGLQIVMINEIDTVFASSIGQKINQSLGMVPLVPNCLIVTYKL